MFHTNLLYSVNSPNPANTIYFYHVGGARPPGAHNFTYARTHAFQPFDAHSDVSASIETNKKGEGGGLLLARKKLGDATTQLLHNTPINHAQR